MKSFRLLCILIAVVVVMPNYEIDQLDGKGNKNSAFAAEQQVAPPQPWISVIKSPKKLVDVTPEYGVATIRGRWKRVNSEKYIFRIPTINSVEIFCAYDMRRTIEGGKTWIKSIGQSLILSKNQDNAIHSNHR